MSTEALVVAIEAVNRDTTPMLATHVVVPQAANPASAAHFEVALTRVADAPAPQQTVDTVNKEVIEAGLEESPAGQASYEFTLHPVGDNQTLQRRLADYLEGFSGRASNYGSDVAGMFGTSSTEGNGLLPAAADPINGGAKPDNGINSQNALKLMKRTFEFAVEVEFVSSASQKSTKVVNDLMKGQ